MNLFGFDPSPKPSIKLKQNWDAGIYEEFSGGDEISTSWNANFDDHIEIGKVDNGDGTETVFYMKDDENEQHTLKVEQNNADDASFEFEKKRVNGNFEIDFLEDPDLAYYYWEVFLKIGNELKI